MYHRLFNKTVQADYSLSRSLVEKKVLPSTVEKVIPSKLHLSSLSFRTEGGFGQLFEAANLANGTFAVKVVSAEFTDHLTLTLWTAESKRELNYRYAYIVKYLDHFWPTAIADAVTPNCITNTLFTQMELLEV